MNKHEIVFTISDNAAIAIELEDSVDNVHCCYGASLVLMFGGQRYLLSNDMVHFNVQELRDMLINVLTRNLMIPNKAHIGYLYNEHLQHKDGLEYEQPEKRSSWIGYRYQLWSPCVAESDLVAWLYNDESGSIVFECTPFYKQGSDIPYEEWICYYKPLIRIIISQEVAHDLVVQTNSVIRQIRETSERQRIEYESQQ